MWPFKKTNYVQQELADKQLDLIARIDESLVAAHIDKVFAGKMLIKTTVVPFISTLLPTDTIRRRISLEYSESYIPRSVAFIVDSYGNWIFLYAVRSEVGSTELVCTMFVELLTRTNNARSA